MEVEEEQRLELALQAVIATMAHPVSKMLFNVAVDPVALGLPEYFDVIKQPMVGTPMLYSNSYNVEEGSGGCRSGL